MRHIEKAIFLSSSSPSVFTLYHFFLSVLFSCILSPACYSPHVEINYLDSASSHSQESLGGFAKRPPLQNMRIALSVKISVREAFIGSCERRCSSLGTISKHRTHDASWTLSTGNAWLNINLWRSIMRIPWMTTTEWRRLYDDTMTTIIWRNYGDRYDEYSPTSMAWWRRSDDGVMTTARWRWINEIGTTTMIGWCWNDVDGMTMRPRWRQHDNNGMTVLQWWRRYNDNVKTATWRQLCNHAGITIVWRQRDD